ncbi:hypothetical protein ECHHL_0634 [Ehrlichia chaffeensis str. Heartland]|nr:hypothetical protein ECHHL_0634 [Ehrlichia chaffeensis str. Heartland]AHX05488.1 hypothetical protein ECHJAX_0418 [Ehrlichia chaffeensis str. Jax]AHX06476.1 hypothetical protein ECHLIB_0415 [Ehrlichia chaffeensis str. Liberty]AHX07832.1 hypothetical protein ECHOSC_0647 [Ehrlichia chaffeensis str. Osceola]AHX08503.1 hypothetical protein ECHSTV_0408 [Ehrlichia chaffeensis str. Saint Vincent]AHX09918.1 hypothetical protein ECHWAK_0416 [Ehrlichia chaffeensis str. Wakulla]AHX10715.1 hypothetica
MRNHFNEFYISLEYTVRYIEYLQTNPAAITQNKELSTQ